MTTHDIIDITGKRTRYTEYIVKAGETTLHQIARDHLYDEGRFKEIKEWVGGTDKEVTKALVPGQVLLIPEVSEDIGTFRLTAAGGSNIRSARDLNSNVLYLAPSNTELHYSKKSLALDSNGRVWVEVRTFTDAHNVVQKSGWILVKDGNASFTNPPIAAAKPTG